ncbi:MAG: peptide ABC transporter substrate-binding protein [Treponema sp.]|nr:peptide ABC transporter substrate-binding protein [Treponema sp.]
MKITNTIKTLQHFCTFCFILCFICSSVFAQDQAEEENFLEDLQLELEEQEGNPDQELQRPFTYIQSVHANNLNPQTASYSSEAQILVDLYEGLFTYNPVSLAPEPALAESYHVSRNKLRWTFKIRQDIYFSDGSPITAADVQRSWLTLLATPQAPYASFFDIIKGAKEYRAGKATSETVGIKVSKDNTSVIVQLLNPAGHLPRLLCHHAFSVIGKKPSVYSGAYTIASQTQNELVLNKNEYYWNAAAVHIPEVHILQSNDLAENAFLYNTGKADWVDGSIDINKVLSSKSVQVHAEFGTQYLFFKNRNQDWNTPEFRNALLTAIPWDQLRKGNMVPAQSFVYPLTGYPKVEGLSYTDLDEATELMVEAREKAGIPQNERIVIKFAIIDADYMKELGKILKEAWIPLGVDLVLETKPAEIYLNAIIDWNADLFSYTWIGDFSDPLTFLELFRGDSSLNPSLWSNPEYDSLLQQASTITNDEEHLKLMAQAEQLLLDSGMILPIAHPVSLNVINLKEIGGWQPNALDLHPVKKMYFKPAAVRIPNLVLYNSF